MVGSACPTTSKEYAAVAEQVDARDLKSLDGDIIRVRFPSAAPSLLRVEFSWQSGKDA